MCHVTEYAPAKTGEYGLPGCGHTSAGGGCTLPRGVVALFPEWLNCTGPHATASSDIHVWLLEVAGTAMTTPWATVLTSHGKQPI